MLPDLHHYGKEISLIMNSGVQFLDFGLKIDWKDKEWRTKSMGNFASGGENHPIRRLVEHRSGEGYCDSSDLSRMVKVEHEISVEQSFKLLDGVWLPIPVLRTVASTDAFYVVPDNLARGRIV